MLQSLMELNFSSKQLLNLESFIKSFYKNEAEQLKLYCTYLKDNEYYWEEEQVAVSYDIFEQGVVE